MEKRITCDECIVDAGFFMKVNVDNIKYYCVYCGHELDLDNVDYDKIGTDDWSNNEPDVFLCDPVKNVDCPKSMCQTECKHTLEEQYAVERDENGTPIWSS